MDKNGKSDNMKKINHKTGEALGFALSMLLVLIVSTMSVSAESQTLNLTQKDSTTWLEVVGGATATLTYSPVGATFDFELNGKTPENNIDYSLIYYADNKTDGIDHNWDGVSPWSGAFIYNASSGSDGSIHMSGSVELETNIPNPKDTNYPLDGGKIWLIPSDHYDRTQGKMINWDSSKYLFEENLRDGDGLELSGTSHLIKYARTNIDSCIEIDMPGEYKLTRDIMDSDAESCIVITSSNVVFDGAGFTIDGLNSGFGSGVYVNNPDVTLSNVTVKNLIVTEWDFGIYYINVNAGNIVNNTASHNFAGIRLDDSSSNVIDGNEVTNNSINGIKIFSNGYYSNNQVTNNNVANNGYGIHLIYEDKTLIDGNNISYNYESGIFLENSPDNTISNNKISYNNQGTNQWNNAGLYLYYSENNTIINNHINNNPMYGVRLETSSHNVLRNNDIVYNCGGNDGVYIRYGHYNTLDGNNISFGTGNGIEIDTSNNNDIMNNDINSNAYDGIYIHDGEGDSNNNHIIDNNITNNTYGINIDSYYYTSNNTLSGNIISNNEYGMGIYRYNSNRIYNNYFNNTYYDVSYESDGENFWNTDITPGENIVGGPNFGGNFWANPEGTGFSQTCADGNKDGICDDKYVVVDSETSNTDYLPLAVWTEPLPPTPSSGSGSDRSTGGGGVVSGEPYDNLLRYQIVIRNLVIDTPVTYNFDKVGQCTYEIVVTGKENDMDVSLRVEELKGQSRITEAPAAGEVYTNFNVWSGTKRIKEAVLKCKVENNWIDSKGLLAGDIKILRWADRQWNQLDTKQTNRDSNYTFYEAITTGFSPFTVTGIKEVAAPQGMPSVTETVKVTPDATQTPSVGQPSNLNWILYLLGLLIILGGLYFFVYKKK